MYLNLREHGAVEDVLRVGIAWQLFARRRAKQDQPSASLGHAEMSGLEDAEGALVTHPYEGGEAELEHHPVLVGHEVPDVLHDEVAGAVVVGVREVGGDQAVLKLAVLFVLKDVEQGEALAGRTAAQHLNLALLWQINVLLLENGIEKFIALLVEHLFENISVSYFLFKVSYLFSPWFADCSS